MRVCVLSFHFLIRFVNEEFDVTRNDGMLNDLELPAVSIIQSQRLCTAFEEALCSGISLRTVFEIECRAQFSVFVM
jgi:hypothetical protein